MVEGPTLADRIAQGPIPLDEALPIAKQIAEALEAAHEAGVIHRDLKPSTTRTVARSMTSGATAEAFRHSGRFQNDVEVDPHLVAD